MSPITMALLGVLAYRTLKGKGRLADMIGQGNAAPAAPGGNPGSELGGLLSGGLGGLFAGGSAGSAISDGLRHLLDRFQLNGQGEKAQSWVSPGPNQNISPPELEQGLGDERIQWLMQQTGLSREQLLAGLSQTLPQVVDRLTPDGRLPTPEETAQQVRHL